jgi:hypothetical protein
MDDKPAAATETLLDRALKADPYLSKVDPAAKHINPDLIWDMLAGGYMLDAVKGRPSKQYYEDRMLFDLTNAEGVKDGIDMLEVRTTPHMNLVHVLFLRGGKLALDAAADYHARGFTRSQVTQDLLTGGIEKHCDPGIAAEPHRNCGGFYVVSAAYGVTLFELIDVVRTHTGLEIKAPEEWERGRNAYVAHTRACDCEACANTYHNQAALHMQFYGVSMGSHPKPAGATAPVVEFEGDIEAARARSTVHEAPRTVQ